MDFSKINELKPYDLNCNIFDVYSYDGLSMQELLCQFFTKINECVKTSNETIDLAEWLVNEGLKQEVVIKLTNWLNDGTLENLINVTLFENLNKKIDNVSSQLEYIENKQFVSVTDFGAIGDGVTNDTQAFKDAFNTKKVVIIPYTKDFYNIDGGIEVYNDVYFNAKVKVTGDISNGNNHTAFLVVADDVLINNPQIELMWDRESIGQIGEQSHHGIKLFGVKNVTIRGGYILNTQGDGICIAHYQTKDENGGTVRIPSRNILIDNVTIEYSARSNIVSTYVDGLIIRDCYLYNDFGEFANVHLEPNNLCYCKNVTIEGCTLIHKTGINVLPSAHTQRVENINVINNDMTAGKDSFRSLYNTIGNVTIKDNKFNGGDYAIKINASCDGKIVVDNNIIQNYKQSYFIEIGVEKSELEDVIFNNNTIINELNVRRNIYIRGTKNLVINNNLFKNLATSSAYNMGAISLQGNTGECVINGNIFNNVGAFALGLNDVSLNTITFTNNIIRHDFENFVGYTKSGLKVSSSCIVKEAIINNNSYDERVGVRYNIDSNATFPRRQIKEFYSKKTTYYNNTYEGIENLNDGDEVINTNVKVFTDNETSRKYFIEKWVYIAGVWYAKWSYIKAI